MITVILQLNCFLHESILDSFSVIDSIPSTLTGILMENKCIQIVASLYFHFLRLAAVYS